MIFYINVYKLHFYIAGYNSHLQALYTKKLKPVLLHWQRKIRSLFRKNGKNLFRYKKNLISKDAFSQLISVKKFPEHL